MSSKLTISIFMIFLCGCKGKAQKNIDNLPITDTCVLETQLDDNSRIEYYKHMTGMPSDTTLFYNKVCNCIFIARVPGGAIYKQGTYRNCLPDGVWTEYHKDGKPFMVTTYKKGVMDGEFRSYY